MPPNCLAASMGGAEYIFSGENDAEIMHSNALINLNVLEACRQDEARMIAGHDQSVCSGMLIERGHLEELPNDNAGRVGNRQLARRFRLIVQLGAKAKQHEPEAIPETMPAAPPLGSEYDDLCDGFEQPAAEPREDWM